MKACMRLLLLVACCACAAARPRTGRDWSKLTDKDWDRIEDEWSTPEEKEEYEFKPPKPGKGVDIDALQKAMEKQEKLKKKGKLKKGEQSPEVKKMLAQTQQTSGPAMLFGTLDYEGCCKKNETEKIGTRWATLMASAGMAVQTYVIDENMVLYSTQAGGFVNEIIEYVTQQTECVFVEFNSQQTPGPAKTPEWIAKDEARKAEMKATQEKKKAEEEAVKKAEEKLKAKKKKKGKQRKANDKEEM